MKHFSIIHRQQMRNGICVKLYDQNYWTYQPIWFLVMKKKCGKFLLKSKWFQQKAMYVFVSENGFLALTEIAPLTKWLGETRRDLFLNLRWVLGKRYAKEILLGKLSRWPPEWFAVFLLTLHYQELKHTVLI